MYYAVVEPFTRKPVAVARGLKDRKLQRALEQFFKPENYFEVLDAPLQASRAILTGGCEGPIPAQPLKEAIEACRRQANSTLRNDRHHSVANPATGEQAANGRYHRRSATRATVLTAGTASAAISRGGVEAGVETQLVP